MRFSQQEVAIVDLLKAMCEKDHSSVASATSSSSSSSVPCDCQALQARIHELEAQIAAQVEEQVSARTRDLTHANQGLQAVNTRLERQSQAMLQQFACMSHEIRCVRSLLVVLLCRFLC